MPARADMLTGTFSYTHMGWEPLPRHLTTLPVELSKAGYHTMGVVDTPFFVRNGFGYDRGFDDFIWVRGQGDDTRPHERADARSTWRSEEDRMVARTVTQAERWLERHHDEQFFLYVDTWDPHEPWDAPEYYTKKYREGYDGEQIYPAYGNWKKAGLERDDVDLVGLGGVPTTMTGDSFGGVLDGSRDEHRPLVVSSWPLYLAKGEIITAVDSKARRIDDYMPLTVTTPERSLILGGPDEEPELYDLARDPDERDNTWTTSGEGTLLAEQALSFLEGVRTPEEYLAPRYEAVEKWRSVSKSA